MLAADTVEALNPVAAVDAGAGAIADVTGTVTTNVDTVAAVTEDAASEITEDVGDVVASVPAQVLPSVLEGATGAILELPGARLPGRRSRSSTTRSRRSAP